MQNSTPVVYFRSTTSIQILCVVSFCFQLLSEGFANHLVQLRDHPPRQAAFDVRQLTGDSCFALPGNPATSYSSRRKSLNFRRSAFKSQKSKSRSVDSNSEKPTARVRTNSTGPSVETTV